MLSTKTYTSIIRCVVYPCLGQETYSCQEFRVEELKKSANSPSLSQVKVHADKLNLVTMSKPDFTDLFKTANEPSISHIRSKASDLGYTVVKQQEYDDMTNSINHPDVADLKGKLLTTKYCHCLSTMRFINWHMNQKWTT